MIVNGKSFSFSEMVFVEGRLEGLTWGGREVTAQAIIYSNYFFQEFAKDFESILKDVVY